MPFRDALAAVTTNPGCVLAIKRRSECHGAGSGLRSGRPTRAYSGSPSAKIAFLIIAWTPQLPSTTWVTPKSTALGLIR